MQSTQRWVVDSNLHSDDSTDKNAEFALIKGMREVMAWVELVSTSKFCKLLPYSPTHIKEISPLKSC